MDRTRRLSVDRLHEGLSIRFDEAEATPTSKQPITHVASASDLKDIPYFQQGNSDMVTHDALSKRRMLRYEKCVDKVLRVFWTTAQNSASVKNDRARRVDDSPLPKGEFMKLNGKLYRALVGPWDALDAEEIGQEEWNDSVGADETMMSRSLFLDGIFEIADTWVRTVEAEDYVEFLWMLFFNLVAGKPPHSCHWRDDAEICFCAPALGVYDGDVDKWGRPLRPRVSSMARASVRHSESRRESSACGHLEPQRGWTSELPRHPHTHDLSPLSIHASQWGLAQSTRNVVAGPRWGTRPCWRRPPSAQTLPERCGCVSNSRHA